MTRHSKKKLPTQAELSGAKPALSSAEIGAFRAAMLAWYDRHARRLPWRAGPAKGRKIKANPYHVWLSEIMLQQTTVAAVIPYFQKFVEKWPRVQDLAAAPREEVMTAWAGLGYYARARNLHECAITVARDHGGLFPADEAGLLALPGIGPYTAAAIASIAFDLPATVVDGNIERVMARYFAIEDPLPLSKSILRDKAHLLSEGQGGRPGDYAQALMDLGATICAPQSPACVLCPLQEGCAGRARGIAATLPRREEKKKKPHKRGYVYWITNGKGEIFIETRPDKGLLGGMAGLPTSEWIDAARPAEHRKFAASARLTPLNREIRHVFTHFSLELAGFHVENPGKMPQDSGSWVHIKDMESIGFPSVFKKFLKLMLHDENVIGL
jgi:A/G-specific adenine glycosylase